MSSTVSGIVPVSGTALLLATLLACAPVLPQMVAGGKDASTTALQQCRAHFDHTLSVIAQAGANDAQDIQVPGYPYLRVDRFLSGLRPALKTDAALRYWVELLRQRAIDAVKIELANLPPSAAYQLAGADSPATLLTILEECSRQLTQHDLQVAERKTDILRRAEAEDEYVSWQRVAGIYPLMVLPVAWGISSWHRETHQSFHEAATDKQPLHGFIRYGLTGATPGMLDRAEVAQILKNSAGNPLHIPLPDQQDQRRLFYTFAPVWQIDSRDDNDHIGSLTLQDRLLPPTVDTRQPAIYTKVSHTRVADRILLQLNYIVWFPARPKESALDLLGGHLDGITWRVTLDTDGAPLVYDSIHNCGCYHLFFPGNKLTVKPPPDTLAEIALVPQIAPGLQPGQRMQIRVNSGQHYIEQISSIDHTDPEHPLHQHDYSHIRSLPLAAGGNASPFDEAGIINSSARGERFLFWPLGVPAPGAMRQWGHHATAFIGRRHFDDIDLITRYFRYESK